MINISEKLFKIMFLCECFKYTTKLETQPCLAQTYVFQTSRYCCSWAVILEAKCY